MALFPALIEEGKATRLKPQVVLSWALCDPSLYPPLVVQVVLPLLFMTTVAEKVWPTLTLAGAVMLTTVALSTVPMMSAIKWLQFQYGPGSVWVLQPVSIEE